MVRRLLNYIKNNNIVIYLLFGALTTAVNFAVFFPLYNICGFSAAASNVIAWVISVIVAFLTNKPLVFKSVDWSVDVVLPEFLKFSGLRLLSGILETSLIYIFVDMLLLNGNVLKVIISVLVVILNYVFSKFVVFKGK